MFTNIEFIIKKLSKNYLNYLTEVIFYSTIKHFVYRNKLTEGFFFKVKMFLFIIETKFLYYLLIVFFKYYFIKI